MLAVIMPYFDPMYLLFMLPPMALAAWAQWRVHSAYGRASQERTSSGLSGAMAARRILDNSQLFDVGIEETEGQLSDHYDPRSKVLRLSHDVFHGRSLASVGIAAHEAGHALQDATSYSLMRIRGLLVPAAATGSQLSMFFMMAGMLLMGGGSVLGRNLFLAGIAFFSLTVLFQLVNLPVEFDASRRARLVLVNYGVVSPQELGSVSKVLNAAALTYVAATITAVLQLLYFLYRAGLLGGRRQE